VATQNLIANLLGLLDLLLDVSKICTSGSKAVLQASLCKLPARTHANEFVLLLL